MMDVTTYDQQDDALLWGNDADLPEEPDWLSLAMAEPPDDPSEVPDWLNPTLADNPPPDLHPALMAQAASLAAGPLVEQARSSASDIIAEMERREAEMLGRNPAEVDYVAWDQEFKGLERDLANATTVAPEVALAETQSINDWLATISGEDFNLPLEENVLPEDWLIGAEAASIADSEDMPPLAAHQALMQQAADLSGAGQPQIGFPMPAADLLDALHAIGAEPGIPTPDGFTPGFDPTTYSTLHDPVNNVGIVLGVYQADINNAKEAEAALLIFKRDEAGKMGADILPLQAGTYQEMQTLSQEVYATFQKEGIEAGYDLAENLHTMNYGLELETPDAALETASIGPSFDGPSL